MTFAPLPFTRLCNGLSGTPRSPGACDPLSCVRALFPPSYSWGGCDFPPGQRSLRGQDCQDLPCGEHDGHHAWLPGGGQRQSGPGPGTWCSEPAATATEPGRYPISTQINIVSKWIFSTTTQYKFVSLLVQQSIFLCFWNHFCLHIALLRSQLGP